MEYLSENKFNVYLEKGGKTLEEPELILSHAEIISNPEKPGELMIRTDSEQFPSPTCSTHRQMRCIVWTPRAPP